MASMPWIKLHTDIIDDPKLERVSDIHKWRFVQLCVLAGLCDNDGALVDGDSILDEQYLARRLRTPPAQMRDALRVLSAQRLLAHVDGVWCVVNFSKRQGRPQSAKRAKWREWQAKHRNVMPDSGMTRSNVMPDSCLSQAIVSRAEKEKEKEKEGEGEGENGAAPAKTSATAPPQPAPAKPILTPPLEIANQPAPKKEKADEIAKLRGNPAVEIYRETFNRWPNARQMRMIAEIVSDMPRWSAACDDWQAHDWKPTNVPGLIGKYQGDREAISAAGWTRRNGQQGARPGGRQEPAGFEAIREAARRHGISLEGGNGNV